MADFGGFEVQTPQEVLAQLQQQQQAIQQLPPRQARNANIQFQVANMFGNPELKRARELETRMTRVNESSPPSTDPIKERTRLARTFDAVKDLDPQAAAQITQQMTAMDNEIAERNLLNRRQETAEGQLRYQQDILDHRRKKDAGEIELDNFAWTGNPNDPEGKLESFDLTNTEEAQAYLASLDNGNERISRTLAERLIGQRGVAEAAANSTSKTDFGDRVEAYRSYDSFLTQGNKLMNRFRYDPETGTAVMDISRGARQIAVEAQALRNKVFRSNGSVYDGTEAETMIDKAFDAVINNPELGIDEAQRATYKASIMNMGYVLARALDPGGRLSDQDVNMAIEMLTGGSPIFVDGTFSISANQIASVMLDRAHDIQSQFSEGSMDNLLYAGDDQQSIIMQGMMGNARNKYTTFESTVKEILGEEGVKFITNPELLPTPEEAAEQDAKAAKAKQTAMNDPAASLSPALQQRINEEGNIPTLDNIPASESEKQANVQLVREALQGKKLSEQEIDRLKRAGIWSDSLEASQK